MSDGDTARETVGSISHRDPEAWCSERGHYRPERPNPGVPGRGHYRTERPRPDFPGRGHYRPELPRPGVPGRGHYRPELPRPGVPGRGHFRPELPRPGVPGRGHYRPRFPARLPKGWHRRRWIHLSNTPHVVLAAPVLFFAVVAFVVCRRRRVIFLRGAVHDGRKGQAFLRPSRSGALHVVARSKHTNASVEACPTLTPLFGTERGNMSCYLATTINSRRISP